MRRGSLAFLASLLVPAVAGAQPVRTWGAEGDEAPAATSPAPSPGSVPPSAPPEPPPSTIGTPIPGSISTPSNPAARFPSPPAATPTSLGFKYLLEGIEVRGNTTTLSRVVLRYVPF